MQPPARTRSGPTLTRASAEAVEAGAASGLRQHNALKKKHFRAFVPESPAPSAARRRALAILFIGGAALVVKPFWRLTSQFDDITYRQPSRLYARPPRLAAGDRLDVDRVVAELRAQGYREGSGLPLAPGRYLREKGGLLVHLRRFPSLGESDGGLVEARFTGDRGDRADKVDKGEKGDKGDKGEPGDKTERRVTGLRRDGHEADAVILGAAAPRLLLRRRRPGAPAGRARARPRQGPDRTPSSPPRTTASSAIPGSRSPASSAPPGSTSAAAASARAEHAHPAAGQEPLSHPGADAHAQGQESLLAVLARVALRQEADPRGVPERDLPGGKQRRQPDRRRGRRARLLRQGRGRARPGRGRDARRHDQRRRPATRRSTHPERAKERRDWVLGRMAELGWSPPGAGRAGAIASADRARARSRSSAGATPYFADAVAPEARAPLRRSTIWPTAAMCSSRPSTGATSGGPGGGGHRARRAGEGWQKAAQGERRCRRPWSRSTRATGGILAYVGGRDYDAEPVRPRRPGAAPGGQRLQADRSTPPPSRGR